MARGLGIYRQHLRLATEGNGLLKLDPVSGRYTRLVKDTAIRNSHLITTAAWGDTILVGGYRSFNAYLPEDDRFLDPVIRHDTLAVSDLMVKKILPLDGRRCLLGTEKGLFIIDRFFRLLTPMRTPSRDPNPGIALITSCVPGTGRCYWLALFHRDV